MLFQRKATRTISNFGTPTRERDVHLSMRNGVKDVSVSSTERLGLYCIEDLS